MINRDYKTIKNYGTKNRKAIGLAALIVGYSMLCGCSSTTPNPFRVEKGYDYKFENYSNNKINPRERGEARRILRRDKTFDFMNKLHYRIVTGNFD